MAEIAPIQDRDEARVEARSAVAASTGSSANHAGTIAVGVASVLGAEKKITVRPLFLGTVRYASPEQMRGEAPTPQTDLYAFGLVELSLTRGTVDRFRLTDVGSAILWTLGNSSRRRFSWHRPTSHA